MRTKNELYQEALRTVARRRQTARAKAEDARAEAEAAVPGLRHAEEEVRVRGIRCALAGAAGKDRTEAAAALSKARQELTALLAASGRPADALEPKFTCKLCQDTGSVQGRTCTCVHKLMQGLRREEICGLKWESVDFQRRVVHIKEARTAYGATVVQKETKNRLLSISESNQWNLK